jgi:hypothetical protein
MGMDSSMILVQRADMPPVADMQHNMYMLPGFCKDGCFHGHHLLNSPAPPPREESSGTGNVGELVLGSELLVSSAEGWLDSTGTVMSTGMKATLPSGVLLSEVLLCSLSGKWVAVPAC